MKHPGASVSSESSESNKSPSFAVLTLTVPSRAAKLARVQTQLRMQREALDEADRGRVSFEVLLTPPAIRAPNRVEYTVGQKRNRLIAASVADYVAFVDDDDLVRPDYLSSILQELDTVPGTDLVVFRVEVHGWQKSGRPKVCIYDPGFRCDRNFDDRYERLPNHVMVWRRALIASIPYDEVRKGEDRLWAEKVHVMGLPRSYRTIDRVLYEYHYVRNDSVCAGTVR